MHTSLQNSTDALFDADALRAQYVDAQMSLKHLAQTSGADLDALQSLCRRQRWNRLRRAKVRSRVQSVEAAAYAQALGAALLSHMLRAVGSWEDFARRFMPQDEADVKRLRDFADAYRLIVHTLCQARPAQEESSRVGSAVVVLPSVAESADDIS